MPDKSRRRPNLLFLYTDEQRADSLAAYGNSKIDMPNLNRLAKRSTVFERAYVSQPVCTPSRSTLLSGLYPHTNRCTTNNVSLPEDVKCLPEMIDSCYATAHHGKWHLGDEIYAQHGFKEWRAIEDMYMPHYSEKRDRNDRSHYHHWLVDKGHAPNMKDGRFNRNYCTTLDEELSKPAYLAEEASKFINEHCDEPFALYVNFLEPHMPFSSCRDGQYDRSYIDLPPNFDHTDHVALREKLCAARYALDYKDEAAWRDLIARYWGLCSLVDTHVGRILNTLDACGLTDDTIIVYTSDHGDMMGSHRMLTKGVMLEEAVRVPFMIAAPGQREQNVIANPVSQIDVVPTLLELMGEETPGHLQGESLVPALNGAEPEHDVVIEWNESAGIGALENPKVLEQLGGIATAEQARAAVSDPVRTIVTSDCWKLSVSPLGEHRLYNVAEDPYEMNNLFGRPEHAEIVSALYGRLREWQQRNGDAVELPEPVASAAACGA